MARAGDHKLISESNRHQHLVLVSQTFLLTGDLRYRDYVFHQIEHWWKRKSISGRNQLGERPREVHEALSWISIYHFLGTTMPAAFRERFLTELARHGYHLEYNLSVYFSPNTHLLGEAVVLHALGKLFPQFRRAAAWRRLGRTIVVQELNKQVHADGSHFEQSTYYHVYAVDFFLLHHLIKPMPENAVARLRAMAMFLATVTGGSGMLPFIGDDDGGRLFHPFGARNSFARATLATCSVLLGERYFQYTDRDLLEQALWWIGPDVLTAQPAPAGRKYSALFPKLGSRCHVYRHRPCCRRRRAIWLGECGS